MHNSALDQGFWHNLQSLIDTSQVVIDRPRGSTHPRYPDMIYPCDYGYLEGTTTADGGGIDVWQGSLAEKRLTGIWVTIDQLKRDSEIKIGLGCTNDEIQIISQWHNDGAQNALWIPCPG